MNPKAGRRFGPYEIQSRLGGGGMGHVYRAWDSRLHREVAVKLLNHAYTMPGMRERFLREARAASALNHPNICTIFDIGEQDGDPYLVMELLEGETLRDRILNQPMHFDEIVSVARDAAEALGAAHAKGVVHRDIKPANIFLVDKPNGGSQAKILDFGLAKIEGGALGTRSRSLDITTVGATVGTLAYMSPEQARGEELDSRSDLFSFGVVMYEMATRQVPFQGATSALVFVQLLNHAPEPVREWNDAVPRELEKIILKLLAKERTARFQTARELELSLIALSEKGSGGWLRKAVAGVPLVRAQDPVARVKRLARAKSSSDPGLQLPPTRRATPIPPSIDNDEASLSRTASDQILPPIVRIRRPDATPEPGHNLSAPTAGVPSTFSPLPPILSRTGSRPRTQGSLNVAGEVDGPKPEPETDFIYSSAGDEVEISPELDETFPPLITRDRSHSGRQLPFHPRLLWISGIAILVLAGLLFFFLKRARFIPAALNHGDVVVLTAIENRTGDKSLDNSLTEALYIELVQSRYFTVRSVGSYRAVRRHMSLSSAGSARDESVILARNAAQRLGARAYLSGSISGNAAPYALHIELRNVSSNELLATAEAHPDSLQQVSAAVDQVAGDLRVAAGEPRSSVDATVTPLASEASSNLAVVQLYAEAETLISASEPIGALADLQQAVALDPRFIQAQMQLAILYQQLHAETAAAEAARLAFTASGKASERTRTLAQAVFERETTGDYPHATALLRHLVAFYPHDSEGLSLLAESLRLQGHMGEALTDAQQAITEDPFNAAAYTQTELALVGLDHYEAAYQLDLQAQHLNLAPAGDSIAAADLDHRQEVVNALSADIPVGKIEYRPDWFYGIYLDNAGRLAAGATLWRSRAEAAEQNDSLKSAAAFLLAQGAMDRALLGDCPAALMMRPANADPDASLAFGRTALFNTAITSALCGDRMRATEISGELRYRYPQSYEVNGYYLADIQAAEDLHDNHPAAALSDLTSVRAFDLISITPFLRGRAHVAAHEDAVGIVDFQAELAHRGLTYLVGSDVYPAAQIGVARAFADSGDLTNSAQAYRTFLALWSAADSDGPLLGEARTHSGN